MQWWAIACRQFGISEQLLFAIPNGGQRNIVTAAQLKAEGVRAGIPDLFLAVPRHEAHGLFVEMKKAKGGRVSEKQSAVMEMLAEQGYTWAVCHGWTEAKRAIESYLCG